MLDEAGHQTTYCSDGLGRLKSVTDAAGNLTSYTYDWLNDLAQVNMGGQIRSFTYSTTGRLITACNAENAACDQYHYDPNGNVKTWANPGGTITTWASYDGFNRPLCKSYNDGTTPAVQYVYDADGFKGTLSSATLGTNCEASTWNNQVYANSYTHDGFGRIIQSSQVIAGSSPYVFSYSYDLADQLTQMTYPSGRKVDYGLDSAGRLQTVKNDATQSNYATLGYTPANGEQWLATPKITETLTWNDRLQVVQLTAGSQLTLGFYPCTGGATACSNGNTGNLQSHTISVPPTNSLPALNLTQTFNYDSLNRLTGATEGGSWDQGYSYDAPGSPQVGNRWVSSNNGLFALSSLTPVASSNYASNNRLQAPGQYNYDSNGNQTTAANAAYPSTFDAEGRMVSNNVNGGVTTYTYDGEGQRVMKQMGAATITYVYDAFGDLAAEYTAVNSGCTLPSVCALPSGAENPCGTPTCYVTVDQLGSTRMVTDANGNVQRRYDYLPSGEEIPTGLGGRATGYFYQLTTNNQSTETTGQYGDGFNPKYTGQLRDYESGLDYMHARYYSPAQGRFISPDPGNAGADPTNPQTWNGYAYVANNPMTLTDPSGEGFWGDLGFILGGIVGSFIPGANIALDAFAGFAFGETLDFARGGVSALSPIPGMGANTNIIGSLGGCGGPLGTCGTLGGDPWSERTGLNDVRDPGRFVFDAVDPNSVELHHVFPQAEEFAAWFEELNINIDKYLIALPAGVHRLSQFGGVHTGADNWNAAWRAFKAAKPTATREEVFKFAGDVIKKFRLSLFAGASSVESMFVIGVDLCKLDPYRQGCPSRVSPIF